MKIKYENHTLHSSISFLIGANRIQNIDQCITDELNKAAESKGFSENEYYINILGVNQTVHSFGSVVHSAESYLVTVHFAYIKNPSHKKIKE